MHPKGAVSLERKEPDVTSVSRSVGRKHTGSAAMLAQPAASTPEELDADELELRKQRRIVIYVQSRPRLAVTGIELLSPGNKQAGAVAQERYLEKRASALHGGLHWVEIDLLRGGVRAAASGPCAGVGGLSQLCGASDADGLEPPGVCLDAARSPAGACRSRYSARTRCSSSSAPALPRPTTGSQRTTKWIMEPTRLLHPSARALHLDGPVAAPARPSQEAVRRAEEVARYDSSLPPPARMVAAPPRLAVESHPAPGPHLAEPKRAPTCTYSLAPW